MVLTLQLQKAYKEKRNKIKTVRKQSAKFTYIRKETTAITKAFKNTNVKITFSTNNTTGKLLATRHHRTKCKYDKCGLYQLTCRTCNKNISDKPEDNLRSVSTNIL